jgi:hypothetical protein
MMPNVGWLRTTLKRSTDAVLGPFGYAIRRTPQASARRAVAIQPPPAAGEALTDEMMRLNRAIAARHGVDPAVHPKDAIYWFTVRSGSASADLSTTIAHYFDRGARSAARLADIAAGLGYAAGARARLLEFAAGYGRVSRHLTKMPFDLVSCDIHEEAVAFLANQLGIEALGSSREPECFRPGDRYDIVFALSFFTHLPRATWSRWLKTLFDLLDIPGYLVFTTHGLRQCELLGVPPDGLAEGFWFSGRTEQPDLDTADYGSTITLPGFVIGEIWRQTGGPIVLYEHAGWEALQDLWVIRREK